ncbi:hypothetical protein [Methylomagnum sp.]
MANPLSSRPLGGNGNLLGPAPGTQFHKVVRHLKVALVDFASSSMKKGIKNEPALNLNLAKSIGQVFYREDLPYMVLPEVMENENLGTSPRPDIGIYLFTSDEPEKITVFEGKRLSSNGLPNKRHREYVCGHEENGKYVDCGGIERFKLSIHGRDFSYAGMIGYVQDGEFDVWLARVNQWICELSCKPTRAICPEWSEEEQLTLVGNEHEIMQSKSVVYRTDDQIHLTHLWVNLISP